MNKNGITRFKLLGTRCLQRAGLTFHGSGIPKNSHIKRAGFCTMGAKVGKLLLPDTLKRAEIYVKVKASPQSRTAPGNWFLIELLG